VETGEIELDLLKEISLELNNYQTFLTKYSSKSSSVNYLQNLIKGIEDKDLEIINHALEGIDNWYTENINQIKSNQHVGSSGQKEHERIRQQIKEFLIRAKDYKLHEDEEIKNTYTNERFKEGYKIFISHSSKDAKICTAFVELLEDLGIAEENILYSSSSRLGIPGDMDIYEYLRNKISQNYYMFYMLSDNYYESVVCLNEMGAAWLSQNDYSIFILPNFTTQIKGVVESTKKAWNITDPIELNNLKNKLIGDFKLDISENKWDEKKRLFLSKIEEVKYTNK